MLGEGYIGSFAGGLETIEMNRLIICTVKPPATIEGMAVCPRKDIAVAVGFFLVEVNISVLPTLLGSADGRIADYGCL